MTRAGGWGWPGGPVSETLAFCLPADYAEALINPIKHVSLMDQRARQLAALIGESEVSRGRAGLRLTVTQGAAGHDCCGHVRRRLLVSLVQ